MTITVPPPLESRFGRPPGWEWNEYLPTRDNQFIRAGWSVPLGARALVTILPGLSEYCEKYFELAGELLRHDFAVAVMDWRGQGLSWRHDGPPDRRSGDDFANDVADARVFLKTIPAPDDMPRILLGHSMGGHIGLRLLHDLPNTFQCAAMTAPMLGLPFPGWLLTGIVTTLRMAGKQSGYMPTYGPWSQKRFEKNLRLYLTSDPGRSAMQRYWMTAAPALRMGGVTAEWMQAALASMHLVASPGYASSIRTPTLIAAAGQEKIVSNAPIRATAGAMPQATLLEIPGSLHEILMERDDYRNTFLDAFHPFVAKHLGPR